MTLTATLLSVSAGGATFYGRTVDGRDERIPAFVNLGDDEKDRKYLVELSKHKGRVVTVEGAVVGKFPDGFPKSFGINSPSIKVRARAEAVIS